jgi:Ca2+-binding EF-hand superfamily protein
LWHATRRRRPQRKIKAACYGTTPKALFSRFDTSSDGTLDGEELRRAMRRAMRIPPHEVSRDAARKDWASQPLQVTTACAMRTPPHELADEEIDKLIGALDDDGSGTLSIDELADFVERGTATFYSIDKARRSFEIIPFRCIPHGSIRLDRQGAPRF